MLFIIALVGVGVEGYAQNITISEENTTLEKVFQEIRKQTGYNVLCDADLVQMRVAKLYVKNASIESVLTQCLAGKSLSYVISKNTITIKRVRSKEPGKQGMEVITGKVTNSKGDPLPGVSIKLKNAPIGVIASPEGRYSITVPELNGSLIFTNSGFSRNEQKINGRTVIDVRLIEEIQKLDEIVVIGYGSASKKDLTGSVSQVQVEDLQKAPGLVF